MPNDLASKLRREAEELAESRRQAEFGPGGGNPKARPEDHIEWQAADEIERLNKKCDAFECDWMEAKYDFHCNMARARVEIEQFRTAIWSDDSTDAEKGQQTPEDAARFVSDLRAEVARLKKWQREMVEKAAAKSLDGYRELGAKCAALEVEVERLKGECHDWNCGCGHWNGPVLTVCAMCGRMPGDTVRGIAEPPDESGLTREQVQESLRDAGIDMGKAQAKLKDVLKKRKGG